MKMHIPKYKILILCSVVLLYVLTAVAVQGLLRQGMLARLPPTPLDRAGNDTYEPIPLNIYQQLQAAQQFTNTKLTRANGHVDLYWFEKGKAGNSSVFYAQHNNTNSEAISYALLIAAQAGDKESFDRELLYMERHMLQPEYGYLMWRLEANGTALGEGTNIAPDADLRAIKALLIAEDRWGERKYTAMIDRIAHGVEEVAVTNDGLLAAYGGVSGPGSTWTTNEVYLAYIDFSVVEELGERRGEPWLTMHQKTKQAVLSAQIHNGLYNSQLTETREYGNGIDGGAYSINSMWLMIRNAESGDPELRASAQRSLDFYKQRFQIDGQLYTSYDSTGNALSGGDAPWVYALVGRAAVALGDKTFADAMINKLVAGQVTDEASPLYGAFPEGGGVESRVGQFTMQESIITLQDYLKTKGTYPQ
jgi:endo-1,4-beta-D-glucanase Y